MSGNTTNRRSTMLRFAIAILALSSIASAEDFVCREDTCPARITEDGEVQVVNHRRGDIVSTEAGWVVSEDDGWEKIKTRDRSPNTPPRPQTTILPMLGSGATLGVGGRQWTGIPLTGGAGTQGDTYSMSWKHDSDGPGPRQPVTISVATERRSGETIREHARRFRAMCEEMQDLFPPNVPETP